MSATSVTPLFRGWHRAISFLLTVIQMNDARPRVERWAKCRPMVLVHGRATADASDGADAKDLDHNFADPAPKFGMISVGQLTFGRRTAGLTPAVRAIDGGR